MAILSVRGVSEDVQRALRVRAAETGETMGAIVERALRKELGIVEKLTWEVIEDDGGGLHLAVFEGDSVIFYGNGYEHNEDGLRADLDALKNGANPRTDAWEMLADPQDAYDRLTGHETGWTVVADQDGVYHDRMGVAAKRVFGEEYTGYTISTGFLAGNLFHDSSDEGGTYDEAESAAKYAEMCKEAIEREYPGATVEVNYLLNASGSTPATLQTLVVEAEDADPADNDQIAEHVDRICEQVWESWDWVVYEEDDE